MTQSTTTTKPNTPATTNRPADTKQADNKQADNKQADNKVDVANRTAPFDFSALEITDEARPTRRSSRGTDPEQLAKLVDALRKSWEQRDSDGYGSGKALMVPTQYSKRVQTMIRKAATVLSDDLKAEIGTNVSAVDYDKGEHKDMSKISFAAKPRKSYTR